MSSESLSEGDELDLPDIDDLDESSLEDDFDGLQVEGDALEDESEENVTDEEDMDYSASALKKWKDSLQGGEMDEEDMELEKLLDMAGDGLPADDLEAEDEEEVEEVVFDDQEKKLLTDLRLLSSVIGTKTEKLVKREKDLQKKKGKRLEAIHMEGLEDVDVEEGGYKYTPKIARIQEEGDPEEAGAEVMSQDLSNLINEMESKLLGEKEWYLKGEATASQRPKDSLVELDLEFPTFAKPRIYEYEDSLKVDDSDDEGDVDRSLDLIIKRRIVGATFDNVEKKQLKEVLSQQKKARMELQFTESRLSLAEIYAEEYATNVLKKPNEAKTKDEKKKAEIAVLVEELFNQLNSLSCEFFVPSQVIHGASTIKQSEAPEQIIAPDFEKDKSQMTKEELKSLRRAKKERKRKFKSSENRKKNVEKSSAGTKVS